MVAKGRPLMESIIIIILSGMVLLFGLMLTIANILRNKTLYLIDWTMITFIFLYGIGFPLVYFSTMAGGNPSNFSYYISQFKSVEIVYYFILVICLILSTKVGWHIKTRKPLSPTPRDLNKHDTKNQNHLLIRKHIKFAWVMLVISFISYYLYAMAYGGFSGLLSYTIAIRSGTMNIYNRFSFLEKAGQFSAISTYVFFALNIDKNIAKRSKRSVFSGLIMSALFSLFFLYSRGGRGSMMFFVLTMILITVYNNSDKLSMFFRKIGKRLIFLPIAFVIMDRLWSRTGESSLFSLLVSSISYPFAAFIVNFQNGAYRFFKDFIQGPFYFLPSSIWSSRLNFTTANNETTYLISGAYKGDAIGGNIVSGTTPNDILTFAYIQADIIGVIIVGFLLGVFLRYFHNKIMRQNIAGIKFMLYSYFIVRFVINLTLYGDIAQIIISNWGFIIYFVLFGIYKKTKISWS